MHAENKRCSFLLCDAGHSLNPLPPLLSSRHFAQSLDIKSKDNARALHGLAACCHAIADDTKLSRAQKGNPEVNSALFEHASGELTKLYREGKSDLAPAVDSLLETRSASIVVDG
jgi:hypothetical protein